MINLIKQVFLAISIGFPELFYLLSITMELVCRKICSHNTVIPNSYKPK